MIRTLGWLNHSLPELLNPGHWPSLASHYHKLRLKYDSVALSVPGVIDSAGRFERPDLVNGPANLPEQLLEALQKSTGCPVTVIKDADAWMMGFQAYAEARKIKTEYPAVLMTFGTGFGISAPSSVDRVVSIEAGKRPPHSWKRLTAASRFEITEEWHVHKIIGRPFFEFVENSHKEWDHLKIREEYTKRVNAALEDILPWIEGCLGGSVRTLVLAGGNTEYVSVRSLSAGGRNVESLTDRLCSLRPDIITVLGVEASSRRPRPLAIQ